MISSKKKSYSIIIPVKKINNYVLENLKHILKIKNSTFEVIIVTNSPQNGYQAPPWTNTWAAQWFQVFRAENYTPSGLKFDSKTTPNQPKPMANETLTNAGCPVK